MLDGWIKSYRQILDWQHFQEPIVLQVWIAILHAANSKDGWLRGRRIRRGEWVTSTAQIMAICGIGSNNTVIDALNTLEASGEIKRERFGNATKITVCHFCKFQGYAENAQPTAQPTAHKQDYIEREERQEKQERQTDDNARAKSSVVVGLVDFLSNWWDVNLTPAQVALIDSKPADYWESFKDEIEQSQWLRTKPIEMVLSLHANVVEGKYRTASKNAPFSSQGRQPSFDDTEEQRLRPYWDDLTEQEQQEYLETHDGKLPWQQ